MVKLFVGNLADSVDSYRLKNLFLQHVHVQECDVLKNFAFVHVVTDEDAEQAIRKLNKYNLEGREIHIERSTSKLRKEPGMSDKCFTCGAFDHKTPNCPHEFNKKNKRLEESNNDNGTSVEKKARLLSSYLTQQTTVQGQSTSNSQFDNSKVNENVNNDPQLPCPQNPELRTLYEQYLESRTRYFFYRDRLSKELRLNSWNKVNSLHNNVAPSTIQQHQQSAPYHLGTVDLTKKVFVNSNLTSAPNAQLYGNSPNITPQAVVSKPVMYTNNLYNPNALPNNLNIQSTQSTADNSKITPIVNSNYSTTTNIQANAAAYTEQTTSQIQPIIRVDLTQNIPPLNKSSIKTLPIQPIQQPQIDLTNTVKTPTMNFSHPNSFAPINNPPPQISPHIRSLFGQTHLSPLFPNMRNGYHPLQIQKK